MEPKAIGPFDSSKDFFEAYSNANWDYKEELTGSYAEGESYRFSVGVRKVLDIIFGSEPFTHSPAVQTNPNEPQKESFVLRHNDLNLDNIYCSEDGTITGIIDWDGTMAVPRCLGPTTIPYFLRRDWLLGFKICNAPHMTFSLERYRKTHSEAISEYMDAKYTPKSAIYQAVLEAMDEDIDGRDWEDLVQKILWEIPEYRRVKAEELCRRLGAGWPDAEKVLTEKIAELLKPE